MAIRNLLHSSHTQDFSDWLTKNNWSLKETKGDFEVIRAKKGKVTFIAYMKTGTDHLSFEDKFLSLVKGFYNSRKEKV